MAEKGINLEQISDADQLTDGEPARLIMLLGHFNSPLQWLLGMTLFAVLAGWLLGKFFWGFELLSHFQSQYLWVFLCCLIWFLCWQNWKAVGMTCLGLFFVCGQLIPYFYDGDWGREYADLRVMSVNVNLSNKEYDKLRAVIEESNADIVCFQEVTDVWAEALNSLEGYPHRLIQPRNDGFGIALFSKNPLTEKKVFDCVGVPWLFATLTLKEEVVNLIVVHALPPVGSRLSRIRNQQLQELSAFVNELNGPTIVAGDFNCTPWSVHFKEMQIKSALQDTRKNHGIYPSWPAKSALGIPIDHILITPDLKSVLCYTGAYIGSDHLPVTCDVRVR